jgi:N-glycosylase/DNA lyase
VSTYKRTLRSDFPVSLEHTALSHGWVNLDPFSFDPARGRLSKVERIGNALATVSLTQNKAGDFVVTVQADGLARAEVETLKERAARWLCLDWDPSQALKIADRLSKPVARYLRKGGGRFLRGSSFYEDFVKTLATVNASWSFTQQMIARIVEGIGKGAFPTPRDVLKKGSRYLSTHVKMGYRATVLIEATRTLLQKGLIDDEGNATRPLGYEDLIAIKGIGNYAAVHLLVLQCDFRRIPVDSEVRPYLADRYGLLDKDIPAFFSPWEDFAFLGYKLSRILDGNNWIG